MEGLGKAICSICLAIATAIKVVIDCLRRFRLPTRNPGLSPKRAPRRSARRTK